MEAFRQYLILAAHVPAKNARTTCVGLRRVPVVGGRSSYGSVAAFAEHTALQKLQRRREDWLVKQAGHALRLFRYFLSSRQKDAQTETVGEQESAWTELIEKIRRVMRLQHKSLQTEKSYLLWLRRLRSFVNDSKPENLTSEQVTGS